MKILIIGNFGYNTNALNGQSVRTRTIKETLTRYFPEASIRFVDVSYLGIHSGKKRILYTIKSLIIGIKNVDVLVMLPAPRTARVIVPFFSILRKFKRYDIHYVAIGGWLGDWLEERPKALSQFKRMNNIYVQTQSLKNKLMAKGLSRVVHLPNYRFYEEVSTVELTRSVKKFVFFSRVEKVKGIELAIQAISRLNKSMTEKLILDIYGPIDSDYRNSLNLQIGNSDEINYKGAIEPEHIINALKDYDVMLFPTYYEGEGFPGAILDAFTAGVPVIASDWKYNSEIINDGVNGLLFECKNVESLIDRIRICLESDSKVYNMKLEALESAKKYHANLIAPILIDKIKADYTKRMMFDL